MMDLERSDHAHGENQEMDGMPLMNTGREAAECGGSP